MFQFARVVLSAGGFAFALRKLIKVGLEQDLFEDHPENQEKDNLISDANV
jgi:hypothetical protein